MIAVPLEQNRSQPDRLLPYIKWAGGKRAQVPRILPIWEQHRHYWVGNRRRERQFVDLTAGALALPLGLRPTWATLNDINPHLINLHQQVANGLTITLDWRNDEAFYYEQRERFRELVRSNNHQTAEAAQIFYLLLRSGHRGLCRFNKKGEFNTPYGHYKQLNYQREFWQYRSLVRNWKFRCGDFSGFPLLSSDFVLVDPPYDDTFTGYTAEGFDWDDQVRLAELLGKHPGPVVAFNSRTDRIVELYSDLGFTVEEFLAPRAIDCNGDRQPAPEVLLTKLPKHSSE